MISIIVSSHNLNYFKSFSQNVNDTIGIPFEIIQVWNPGIIGICEAYNKGALNSKYEYLIFCHEDVFFESKEWGNKLITHFNSSSDIGVIGVAGGTYKSNFPSSWSYIKENKRVYINQDLGNERKEVQLINPYNEIRSRVVVLDGVFLSVKRHVWEEFKFNEKDLKGFHGYDIDYSLLISNYYKNYVIYDVLLTHYSVGNPDRKWFDAALIISNKWKDHLPKYVDGFDQKSLIECYNSSFELFNNKMKSLGFSRIRRLYNFIKFWKESFSIFKIYGIWKRI